MMMVMMMVMAAEVLDAFGFVRRQDQRTANCPGVSIVTLTLDDFTLLLNWQCSDVRIVLQ